MKFIELRQYEQIERAKQSVVLLSGLVIEWLTNEIDDFYSFIGQQHSTNFRKFKNEIRDFDKSKQNE